MTRDATHNRVYAYVSQRSQEVLSFQEAYEQKHAVNLGSYPYDVDDPAYDIAQQTYVSDDANTLQSEVERVLESHVEQSVALGDTTALAIDPDLRQELYQDTVEESTDALRHTLSTQDPSLSASEIDDTIVNTISTLEDPQAPSRLSVYREAEEKGVALVPSDKSQQVDAVQGSMEAYYEHNPRPSEEMELLISEAEMNATSLDKNLERILDLEQQGVNNPLAEPRVDDTAVSVEQSDRELLKTLYRKKREDALIRTSHKNDLSEPDQGLDI